MRDETVLDRFMVLDAAGEAGPDTLVEYKHDTKTGYGLVTITQENGDGTFDVVCISREDAIRLAEQLKGH